MRGARSGFTLVEILIATAILLVIVMLVSIVFQQQSGAIQAGQDRIKGQAALRNTIGFVVRDLSLAVDSKDYPGLPANSFSQGSIAFLATTGDAAAAGTALERIQYQNSGGIVRRTVTPITMASGMLGTGSSASAEINDRANALRQFKFSTSNPGTFPESVTITASFQGNGNASLVSGASAGKDRDFRTEKDNIYAGRGRDGL